jgi:hypothetical protein
VSDIGRPWNSTETAETYRKWFPVLIDHSTFDAVGFEEEAIGLPQVVTLDLKRKVLAAAIAHKLGISLSYAERRYVQAAQINEPRELGLSRRIDALFQEGNLGLCAYVDALRASYDDETTTLDDLSNQFFFRNMAGLEAAKKLSDLGYLCEVAVILRSLLEQFAFAAKVRTLSVETKLEKIKPIECVNYLKSIEKSSGKLYGLLSKYTHFEFDHHTHFFSRSLESIFTIQRDSVLRSYSTHLIFLTMLSMSGYVSSMASKQLRIVPTAVSNLEEFGRKVAEYSKRVCELFPSDRVLAGFDSRIAELTRAT